MRTNKSSIVGIENLKQLVVGLGPSSSYLGLSHFWSGMAQKGCQKCHKLVPIIVLD